MLENVAENVKRYAPPPQRNRVLNRRKSGGGERFERVNFPYGSDGEKNQASYTRAFPLMDHGEAGNINIQNESPYSGMIAIDGCCSSDAARLLNERWVAAMNSYNDPSVHLSERPMMYSGASGSSGGHLKLPHQMDFSAELRRAMQNTNASTLLPTAGDRSGL